MKPFLLLCTIWVSTLAEPNGYYQQEYNYRTSSSSYKNHELQHRNDDEGYYSKAGDLEGRLRPRVNAHSQHSEYVNPKLQHAYRIGTDRTSSFGQLHAQNRFQPGEPPFDHPEMGGAAFGYMPNQQSYGVNSDLRQVTASLQEEMERELQRAVYDHYQRAVAYGGSISQAQVESDRRILEEELRRNMTMRLQEALKTQYGNQGVRGAYSYSIINGRLQPTANYNNQELVDLTRQMEANLMRHLEQQVQTYYHTRVDTQVHTQRNTYRHVNGEVNGNYPSPMQQRPNVYHQYPQPHPVPMQPHPQPRPIQVQPHPVQVQPRPVPVQPHPMAPIPDSITTVATRVQTELNEILNKILEDTQRRYFAENSYNAGVNYDRVLAQLQDELRANITFHFDDQIKRAYGYSNYASKYSMEDIENLRRQIETNLVTKLNRDFNRQREKFFQTHNMFVAQHSQPIPTHIRPIPVQGQPIPGNQVFYSANNVNYHRDIAEMQRQLQEQLSRQLQTALMQQSYRQAHMYTDAGSNFNPQVHYQATLDQLTAELNRNLTHQMQLLNAQQFESGAYGAQLAQMRSQLQHDLMRQLQQGLQQSFSRYSSWSSSASHSSRSSANYRPVRGFDPNLYRMYGGASDVMGEDCMMGDDPSVYQQQTGHDHSIPQTEDPTLVQQIETGNDLTQQIQDDDDLTQQLQTHDDLTQQIQDDDDLTQQVQSHDDLTQQVQSHDDLTQQVQSHDDLTQQVQDHDDLTQQVPGHGDLTQQVQDHDDLTQQVQDQDDLTQQVQTHNDLTQQSQDQWQPLYSRPQIQQSQTSPQQPQVYSQMGPSVESAPVPTIYPTVQSSDWGQDQTQQTQTHDDLTEQVQTQQQLGGYKPVPSTRPSQIQDYPRTQQIQDLTQQTEVQEPVYEPLHRAQTVNQIYSQPPQQEIPPQSPVPIRYQIYRTQPQNVQPIYQPQQTYTQENRDVYFPRRQEPYDVPQYTTTYQWQRQRPSPSIPNNTVGQRVQYYEQLIRQRYQPSRQQNYFEAPKPYSLINNQHHELPGQQIESDVLSQQIQDPGQRPTSDFTQQSLQGQQTQDLTQQLNRDLTQQTVDSEFAPLVLGNTREKENLDFARYPPYPGKPGQLADQQLQNNNPGGLTQQQAQVFTNQQNQDLTQQSRDLTQQTEDLSQQYQDLTQQNQKLVLPNQYLNQQSRDLSLQSQDLTHQSQDLTQQTQDLTQQQNDDLTQQTQDLTQQTQDLTQQTEDSTQQNQQNQGLIAPSPYYIEQTQDITQQSQEQIGDIDQPIEAQVSSNNIFPDQPSQLQQTQGLTQQPQNQHLMQQQQNQDLTQQQQNQDLTQQQQNEDLTQQQQNQDLTQQQQNQQFDEESTTIAALLQKENAEQSSDVPIQQSNPRLTEAQRESQRLIDLLRNEQQQQHNDPRFMHYSSKPVYSNVNGQPVQVGTTRHLQQNEQQIPEYLAEDTQRQEPIGPLEYHPRPVYADVNGQQQQVGTTRQLPSGRSLISQPNQVNYAEAVVEPNNIETTGSIEPIQPQVASEVQQVDDLKVPELEEPEGTTKKPGFWARVGKSIKNKIG